MKPDKQHIDDLFRENLSDFVQNPAKSSWKRISARLLWEEVSHLRFANVPRLWYAITAGSIIVLTVLFTSILADKPAELQTISEISNEAKVEAKAEQLETHQIGEQTMETAPKSARESSASVNTEISKEMQDIAPSAASMIPNTESTETALSDASLIVESSETASLLPEKVFQSKESKISQAENVPADAVNPESRLIPDKESVSEILLSATANQKTEPVSEPTSERQNIDNTPLETLAEESKNLKVEDESSIPIPAAASLTQIAEVEIVKEQSSTPTDLPEVIDQTIEDIENPIVTDDFAEIQTGQITGAGRYVSEMMINQSTRLSMIPGLVQYSGIPGNENAIVSRSYQSTQRTHTPSGKVQKHNTRNSILASIFRGEYKPPKRSFQDPITAMYGGAKPYFTISAYFSPEITEYQRIASQSRERSYYGGLALTYNSSRYVLQTGVEYSSFRDMGDYMVNMSTYDSVGFYHHVTGFEIDPNNPDSVIFHTKIVAVWDSVQHHSHQQTKNNYTYLQVPLLIGYKAMERGLFSAHIKAGPSFSLLLNRKEPSLNFEMPGATINGIDNYTAPRLKANVQLLVSVAMHLQFTEKFGLMVEPTYRYYVNPVYDINSDLLNKPYGVSVKTGVFYNF